MEDKTGAEKVFKIEPIDKLSQSVKVVANVEEISPETTVAKSKFDAAVNRADTHWEQVRLQGTQVATVEAPSKPSPIQEMSIAAKKITQLQPASTTQIIGQSQDIKNNLNTSIQTINEQLKTNPDVKISPVYEASLSEKLVHVDSSLKSALGITGVEVKGSPAIAPTPEASKSPLLKFLGYLTNGDRQLSTIVTEVQSLDGPGGQKLTPAKLLAVQIKLSFVQQELEFFTNVLNKALESTKTIMNVQV